MTIEPSGRRVASRVAKAGVGPPDGAACQLTSAAPAGENTTPGRRIANAGGAGLTGADHVAAAAPGAAQPATLRIISTRRARDRKARVRTQHERRVIGCGDSR